MHFNHYGGTAAQLAAALANAPATRAGYQTVVDEFVQPRNVVAARQVAALVTWAQRLRTVFAEGDVGRQVAQINALLAAAASRPFVSRHDGLAPHLHYAGVENDVVSRIQARTAAGLAHLLCEYGPDRLGRCQRTGCDVVYVDTSRNGRRRFCSLRCANRVRVANHRACHRPGVGPAHGHD